MSKNRFEVSTEGLRDLQSGREPWRLAKELISNAWDESTTLCDVRLESISPKKAVLTVYDDGGGFASIEDAWTLMAYTPKRSNPNVRGRFNIGEKEILSVAIDATIRTSGKIISFPKGGGRTVTPDRKKQKGTHIFCTLPWGPNQVEETIKALRELMPPKGIDYQVNRLKIDYRAPDRVIEGILDTVLASKGPNQPLRNTRRKTDIEIYRSNIDQSQNGGKLLEMGIPIQSIHCPYFINIMQKIPLPPNRDAVRDSYLREVYAIVLNAMADEVPDQAAGWVSMALEHKTIEPEAVKTVIRRRFGDKVVLWSSDQEANEKALNAGYEVIHARSLGSEVAGTMQSAGLEHASDIFRTPGGADYKDKYIDVEKWTDDMYKMANFARRLCKELLGFECKVAFYSDITSQYGAVWVFGSQLHYNIGKLGYKWFKTDGKYHAPDQIGLNIHEMAHVEGNGHMFGYQDKLEELAGKAVLLAIVKPEIFEVK